MAIDYANTPHYSHGGWVPVREALMPERLCNQLCVFLWRDELYVGIAHWKLGGVFCVTATEPLDPERKDLRREAYPAITLYETDIVVL